MTAHPGPMPVPARVTAALDVAGLWGPEVDLALGGEEPITIVESWIDWDGTLHKDEITSYSPLQPSAPVQPSASTPEYHPNCPYHGTIRSQRYCGICRSIRIGTMP